MQNFEKTIEEQIASNDKLCWFCGANGNMNILKKSYSYSEERGSYTITDTQTVAIHICDDCKRELNERRIWKIYSSAMIFVVLLYLFILLFDSWVDFSFKGWFFSIGSISAISLLLGFSIGEDVRKKLDKGNIREFTRNIDDHPQVKYLRSKGYN